MKRFQFFGITLVLCATAPLALADGPPPEKVVLAGDCMLEFGRHSVIGVNIYGTIKEINVREGERVRAGQILGRLRDEDLRADYEVANADAENTFLISQAQATFEQNQIASEVNKRVVARNTGLVSLLEINQQIKITEAAKWQVEQAKFGQKMAKLRREQVAAQISLKALICPHDGIVVEIFKRQAESAMVNEPIMRVANSDFFRITGSVDIKDAWRVKAGQQVRISPYVDGTEIAIEKEAFPGELTFVDRAIDPKSHTCRVIAEVKNRDDLLRAGLKVRMEIFQEEGSVDRAVIGASASAKKP